MLGESIMSERLISVLIPSYNESENIREIHKAIHKIFVRLSSCYEVIFVDDGSSDDTLAIIQELAHHYSEVKYISFTRNFGKESALFAGLQCTNGDAVIIMDGDLQHPTNLIHELLEGFKEGYDQVIAKRNRKGESFLRSRISKLYYTLMGKLVDVKLRDGEGDFRLLSRRAVNSLLTICERNRFSKGLFSWIGYDHKIITYDNEVRNKGESKWSFRKLIDYGIEGVVSFNHKPLRLCLYVGLITLSFVLLYILIIFIEIMYRGIDVPGYFTIISSVLFLGGVQLVSLGVIGEYIGRIYYETKQRPLYLVRETNLSQEKKNEADE
jgi:glycosyltransferase involved in cell wall biosynthesis